MTPQEECYPLYYQKLDVAIQMIHLSDGPAAMMLAKKSLEKTQVAEATMLAKKSLKKKQVAEAMQATCEKEQQLDGQVMKRQEAQEGCSSEEPHWEVTKGLWFLRIEKVDLDVNVVLVEEI